MIPIKEVVLHSETSFEMTQISSEQLPVSPTDALSLKMIPDQSLASPVKVSSPKIMSDPPTHFRSFRVLCKVV